MQLTFYYIPEAGTEQSSSDPQNFGRPEASKPALKAPAYWPMQNLGALWWPRNSLFQNAHNSV